MLAFTAALSALVATSFVSAEASQLQLQAEEANFVQSKLVPDLLAEFNPTALMNVSFSGTQAQIGQPLTVEQANSMPTVTIDPGMNATLSNGTFTVAMVDPAAVGSDQSGGQTRHWLVNNVKVGQDGALSYPTDPITNYGGPLPPSGSGPHRYTILLLPQPESFKAPEGLNTPGVAISAFNFPEYITSSGLEAPIAGFYFTVEQGQSSQSLEATSAVATSTLPAFGQATGAVSSAAASGSARVSSVASAAASKVSGASSKAAGASQTASGNASAAGKTATLSSFAVAGLVAVVGLAAW